MQFAVVFFTLTCLVLNALAQGIQIGAPLAGSDITAGSNITVEVDRPNTLTGSTEVSIVIGLQTCVGRPGDSCDNFPVDEAIGHVLYIGPYAPAYQNNTPGQGFKPPYQNFTVAVPSNLPKGEAVLTVSHFSLIGAGPWPSLEVKNTSLTVV